MNLRNTFITLGIVLAVLALGIAYAAMNSQTLNVVGNVATTTDDSNLWVYFDENENSPEFSISHPDAVETSAEILDDHNAKISVSGLSTQGQTVYVYFDVRCESQEDVAAKIRTSLVENFSSEWFKVNCGSQRKVDGILCSDDEGEYLVLRNGGTTRIYVRIELIKTPITDEDIEASTGEFYINLDAEPIRNDASVWEDDIQQIIG